MTFNKIGPYLQPALSTPTSILSRTAWFVQEIQTQKVQDR